MLTKTCMKHAAILRNSASLALAASFLAMATTANAAGVTAGSLIENTASASYNTGGPTRTVDSNKVTVKVDELLDVAIASQDASAVPLSGSGVLTYRVTNTGNGAETFALTANPAVAGNDFDVTVTNLAFDTNANGIYDSGDTILANGGTSPSIDPDQSLTIFVLVTAPDGATDGQNSQVNLLAQASTGTGTPGTTFPGAGAMGSDAVVGASSGSDDALGSLIARIASVTLIKSATITDPFGGARPVPGATITYSIVATVGGSGAVDGLTISDTFPMGTTYVPGSLTLDATALTDAADSDVGQASASGVSVAPGATAAGASRTVTFDVTINTTP